MDFLEKGRTVTGNYYSTLLVKLRDEIKSKRPWKLTKGILFNQDNAPLHKATVTMANIRDFEFEIVPHHPYSPDLTPSDYYLFPYLKKHIGGQRYSSSKDVLSSVEGYFGSLTPTDFWQGINKLRERWDKYMRLWGDYVEK